MNSFVLLIEKYTVKYFIQLLFKTIKITELNGRPDYRCIYLFWHRNLIPLLYLHQRRDIVILISASKDGELISGPASLFGYKPVRGSSSKKSYAALRELIRLSKDHSLAISPDGPTGPREIIKANSITLSYITGLPIVCVAADIDKEYVFRTWDSFRLPKFFSKVRVLYSEPHYIKTREEIDNKRLTIQHSMDSLTAEIRESSNR